jgi:glycerol-3-phosphate dehydrogenase
MFDVIIIGAGVIGCAIARELSRYEANILVLEKESDVCEGTSKANSGIIHAGYDAKPGSLKAKLNVLGNEMMTEVTKDLGISFIRNGSLVVCFEEQEVNKLQQLYEQGIKNGVSGLSILNHKECLVVEPALSKNVVAGLFAKSAGVICPFTLTIALAENAFTNGVKFQFNETVVGIESQDGFLVKTNKGSYQTRIVINAAGVYADLIHNMVSEDKMTIHPRKGEYCLFDKVLDFAVEHTVFQLPSQKGKGILVTKTVHGNQMIGPTANDKVDKEDITTSEEGMEEVIQKAMLTLQSLDTRKIITSFAGLRAHEEHGDFIIEEVKGTEGFIDVAGIASPGLTSAPAIGAYVRDIVVQRFALADNPKFSPVREPMIHINELSLEDRIDLVHKQPEYGSIICRCEMVSEGEVIDSIRRPLGATTLDGIKRRTRAMSGRCQAGFCTTRCLEILAREQGVTMEEITKRGEGSYLLSQEGSQDEKC